MGHGAEPWPLHAGAAAAGGGAAARMGLVTQANLPELPQKKRNAQPPGSAPALRDAIVLFCTIKILLPGMIFLEKNMAACYDEKRAKEDAVRHGSDARQLIGGA